MAGSITISSITLDSDNTFSIKSNTGTKLFVAGPTGIDVANSIAATTITDSKILSIANTKITGNITTSQIAPSVTLTTPLISGNLNFDANGTSAIRLTSANTLTFHTTGAEDVRIDSSGNVMINAVTAQVGAKLSVTGGIQGTITSSTNVASTSGASIDFTSIPSWVKRITVMFNGISTTGTSSYIVQLGVSGSPETTGYTSIVGSIQVTAVASEGSAAGFIFTTSGNMSATSTISGAMTISLLGSNTWTCTGNFSRETGSATAFYASGAKTLAGTLNMIRITTIGGSNTFDAGSINILYGG
jgi:hypothetical protein